jgi:hypothetical protein
VSGDGRGALVTVAAAASLIVVGLVTGFIGILEATALVRLGAVHISAGAVIAGVANCAFGLLAIWGLGSRDAAALPALGWFGALAAALFGPRPGGDILLPGSGWDVISFVVAGALGAAVAAASGGRLKSPKSPQITSPEARPTTSPETPPDR